MLAEGNHKGGFKSALFRFPRLSRELLARAWAAGSGPGDGPLTIDLDSTLCETYGLCKEGARHRGYTGQRGYHPLLAIAAGTGDVLMARLRKGRANTVRGAAHFLRETVGRVRYSGTRGQLTVRADSGFYTHAIVAVCRKMDVRYSITVRQHARLRNIIEAIPETDWTPIPYWMDGAADVAETTYVPFQDEPDAAPVRLIVRRVQPTPGSQLALFASYRYHGFITDRDGETLEPEADHRRHAEIENAIRDLKYGVGLNHLPSGRFPANGAWLAVQVIAHNLARWTARIGLGEQLVTTKTLRRRFFSLAGRLTRSARRPPCICPSVGPGKPSSVAPWPDCEPCHSQPDGARLPLTRHPANGTSPPTRAKSASERLLLHAALTISLTTATVGRHRRSPKRLQTAANLPSTRIRARIIAPVTPSPPLLCPHAVQSVSIGGFGLRTPPTPAPLGPPITPVASLVKGARTLPVERFVDALDNWVKIIGTLAEPLHFRSSGSLAFRMMISHSRLVKNDYFTTLLTKIEEIAQVKLHYKVGPP